MTVPSPSNLQGLSRAPDPGRRPEWGIFVHVKGATHYAPLATFLAAYGRAKAIALFKDYGRALKYVEKHDPDMTRRLVVRELFD